MSGCQENSGKHRRNAEKRVVLQGPVLIPGPGLGWTPGILWWMCLTVPQVRQSNVDEHLVNNQIKKKKGILFEPNRIITLETASQKL